MSDLILASDLGRTHRVARDLDFAIDLTMNLANAFTKALTTYVSMVLFLYRPTGMLPAYEGLLLIRERPKEEGSITLTGEALL